MENIFAKPTNNEVENNDTERSDNEDFISLERDVEEVSLPFLTPEKLSVIFELRQIILDYVENLKDEEIESYYQSIYDFDKKLKFKASQGELRFGDNVLASKDLPKFGLYSILIGGNLSEKTRWVDLEDGLIEKFIRNGFKE